MLKESQTLAQTYNTRQHLLGLPVSNVREGGFYYNELKQMLFLTMKCKCVLQYKSLQKLLKDFKSVKDLWITTSNWLEWNKSWLGGPLSYIKPEQLQINVTDALKTMNECVEHFKDVPRMKYTEYVQTCGREV